MECMEMDMEPLATMPETRKHLGLARGPANLQLYETLFKTSGSESGSPFNHGLPDSEVGRTKRPDKDVDSSVRPDKDVDSSAFHELYDKFCLIFIKLQTVLEDLPDENKKRHLVGTSESYRSALRACTNKLPRQGVVSTRVAELSGGCRNPASTLRATELIWHLCEVLFIEEPPAGTLMLRLRDWAEPHETDETEKAIREVLQSESPAQHRRYWEAVTTRVLQGRVDDARHMLARWAASMWRPSRDAAARDAFELMDELLSRMPVYDPCGAPLVEFDVKWRHWHEMVDRCLQRDSFSNSPRLEAICRILAGDEDAMLAHKEQLGTWYRFMVATLLYSRPAVRRAELHYYAQSSMTSFFGPAGIPEPLDNILMWAFGRDVIRLVEDGIALSDPPWFVAHLADLLAHRDLLPSPEMREILLLTYASALFASPHLWQLAPGYCDGCPQFGRTHLERQMKRVPLDTEQKALEVLEVYERRRMCEQARSVCKIMANRALRNSLLGPALSWAIRAKDGALVALVADRFLQDYRTQGAFHPDADMIDDLGPDLLLSDRLAFLGKYREFRKLYEGECFGKAGELLVSLVSARVAPGSFWWTLLSDAAALAERKEGVFSARQTYELMAFVEELTSSSQTGPPSEEAGGPTAAEDVTVKVELFRLALARNLARVIVKGAVDICTSEIKENKGKELLTINKICSLKMTANNCCYLF